MCIHEFYISKVCGHNFPKLPPSAVRHLFFNDFHETIAVPQSPTCAPVKLALKFFHDQVLYLPTESTYGAAVVSPRLCPTVHPMQESAKKRAIREQEHNKALTVLKIDMFRNGLGPFQESQAESNALVLGQCSNRGNPNASEIEWLRHQQYPPNMYGHVESVRTYQARPRKFMMPNVKYFDADFGCGGPFSPRCLVGWDGISLLTNRLHLWGDEATHPEPCNLECLGGWSGRHVERHRRQTWGKNNVNRRESDHEDLLEFNEDGVLLDYSWVGHRPPRWRIEKSVWIQVPKRLREVLYQMSQRRRLLQPEDINQACIGGLLARLPEAFDEEEPLTANSARLPAGSAGNFPEEVTEKTSTMGPYIIYGSECDYSLVSEPEEAKETPEEAETRRQEARKVLREKIDRAYPNGARARRVLREKIAQAYPNGTSKPVVSES